MSADLDPFIQHLRLQAGICREFGSAFSENLLIHIAQNVEQGGAFGRLALPWAEQGVRQLFAEAVALRILGALHSLALTHADEELASLYPTPERAGHGADMTALLPIVLNRHGATFDEFMASPPQTNEVRRSLCLVGGFLEVAARTGLPLRCLEIGASAGLNMNWDRYRYDFGAGQAWGDPASPVRLSGDWSGGVPPISAAVSVVEKRACDQNPIDIRDEANALRLQAYVWSDQFERLERLRAAIATAWTTDLPIDKADAAAWVAAHAVPMPGVATVLYHSVVWTYLPSATAEAITRHMHSAGESASEAAPLAWLRMEADPGESGAVMTVRLTIWPNGEEILLGRVHPHGANVSWMG